MNLISEPSSPWYAVSTRARYEALAAMQIEARGYEVFLPLYKERRRWSDRVKVLELPLFAGYLFCRLDVNNRLPVLSAPGVVQIVGTGKTPIAVDAEEIDAIRAAVKSNRTSEPCAFAKVGARVRVDAGPLCGVEGIILAVKGQRRLILSVSLLQRSVSVEIENDAVSPLPSALSGSTADGTYCAQNQR
jgi:transcription antitermination factor NusG